MNAEVKKTGLSLSDLNLTKKCETAFEFELVDESSGKGKGVFLSVIGSQSASFQEWIRGVQNTRKARNAMAAKRGKEIEETAEDEQEFLALATAKRIVAWRGIDEPFTPALALQLATHNVEVRNQVITASNDLSNFTKG